MAGVDPTIDATSSSHVTVRVADEGDAPTLARLAALDSAPLPAGPTLVAEIDGEAAAALPIAGGAAVADPFRRTAAVIELLELRAAQLRGQGLTALAPGEWLRSLIRHPRAAPLR